MIDRERMQDEETAILHPKDIKNMSSRRTRNKLGYIYTIKHSIAVKMNNGATDSYMNEFHNCNVEREKSKLQKDILYKIFKHTK